MTNVEILERLSEYAAGLFALCNDIAADIDRYENRAQLLRAEFLTRLRNKEERQNINEEGHAVFILPDKEVKLLPKKLKKTFSTCGYKLLATRREDTGVW